MNRTELLKNITEHVCANAHIVALIDYGSSSENRSDAWSDLDLAIFIHDEAFEDFNASWKDWAAQFGNLLLAYIGGIGHPWTVYRAEPIPTRVDFTFFRASEFDKILAWPCSPASINSMVLVDKSSGEISANVAKLVGKSLSPQDPQRAFEQVAGDFWYYLLRLYSKVKREQWWAVRFEFNFIVMGNLFALLRIESSATERWQGSTAATAIENATSPQRLAQLDACIPGGHNAQLLNAIRETIQLGRLVCDSISAQNEWQWSAELAAQVDDLYRSDF